MMNKKLKEYLKDRFNCCYDQDVEIITKLVLEETGALDLIKRLDDNTFDVIEDEGLLSNLAKELLSKYKQEEDENKV